MTTPQEVQQFIGRTAVDSEGNKIGKVGQVYLDERSDLPLWVTVATGMLGTRQSFAPIDGSRFDGDQVTLAVSKDLVKDAPSIDDDGGSAPASRKPSTGTMPTISAAARQPGGRGTATAGWPTAPPELRAGTPRVQSPMTR